jgi:hypothetical protein
MAAGCGKEKTIIRYKDAPAAITLVYPPSDTFITIPNPTFIWRRMPDAVHYQLQVASAADFISRSFDVQTTDTFYTTATALPNGTHFWRVRSDNVDGVWGDWSDAEIRTLFKSDYVNYFELLSETDTYGIPQDVLVRNDTAFVADGQADLTMIDVSNPAGPVVIHNLDSIESDFAKEIYISPIDTFPYVFVADMDGRVFAYNLSDTSRTNDSRFGTSQNLEGIAGFFKNDTLWIASVSSFSQRKVSYYQIQYIPYLEAVPGFVPDYELTADGMDVCVDSTANKLYVASGIAGLIIFDITDVYNPVLKSTTILSSSALAVDVKDGYAYVACDHAGLYVVDVRNSSSASIAEVINTSGRTKDVQAVGDYVFIADGSGGLKAIDISVPDSAHFVASFTTPYAYGVFANEDYIYVCDRDRGLMVFENRTSN